jgi:hypothetical protein
MQTSVRNGARSGEKGLNLTHYRGPMSGPRVPGGVVHKLPGDLRNALIANPTALDAWKGHHAAGPERVHLLGPGCQAGDDPRPPHSPDPGGAGGRPASALLLARVQAPRAHWQLALQERPHTARPACPEGCYERVVPISSAAVISV